MSSAPLRRRLAAEFAGTAFLLAAVVGSGIMGERLAGGAVGPAQLAGAVLATLLAAWIFVGAGTAAENWNLSQYLLWPHSAFVGYRDRN